MPITFYMDAHIPRAITLGLRMRKVDVVTAQEDGADTLSDSDLLDRATHLNRVLLTFDDDLLAEACNEAAQEQTIQRCDLCPSFAHFNRTLHSKFGADRKSWGTGGFAESC